MDRVLAGDLDDNTVRLEAEVHAGDGPAVLPVHELGRRARQPGPSHEREEPALQHGVATGVNEQLIER